MKMFSQIRGLLMASCILAFSGFQAGAATYIDSYPGNDPFPDPYMDSPALAKCDTETDGGPYTITCATWLDGHATGDYSDAFSLIYDDNSGVNFNWTFDEDDVTGTTEVLFPKYVLIKQSSMYYAWELDGSEIYGGFIQTDLGDISHVSFYDGASPPPPPPPPPSVPLPAGLPILVSGLGALMWLRRKKQG